ncbi:MULTISPECIES: apolipoprotein N-acyltransferase [unclassified Maridesulfovibrio]|uniref:apolipoprotein N-acyltransferase n=1 Tax=unclassified Maridesulfovibrio TaxID=2794999 RepID=UPI003B3F4DC4
MGNVFAKQSGWRPPQWSRLFLISASAGLIWLSLPSAPLLALPFVALVPFAFALRGCSPWSGLIWGWGGGTLIWSVSIWWVFNGSVNMIGMSAPGALASTAVLCLYQGLPYALLGLACGWMERRGHRPGPLYCAALLGLLVALRPVICPGTPAVVNLHRFPVAIQTADLGGMYFVGFLVFLSNWLVADILASLRTPRKAVANAALLIVLLGAMFGYGTFRLEQIKHLAGNAQANEFLTITSIQPNIPLKGREGLDDSGPFLGNTETMVRETERAADRFGPADLVLWPELPGDESGDCESLLYSGVNHAAQESGGPILAAFVEHEYGDNKLVLNVSKAPGETERCISTQRLKAKYNALWLIGEDNCGPVYRKVKLVPFSERDPLRKVKTLVGLPTEESLDYSPGAGPVAINLENGKQVQPLICFESGFPLFTRDGVKLGADAFVSVSDDAWFASETAAHQHLSVDIFRSVELRRPLVRCSNNGAGAHVRASGEIVPETLTPMDVRTFRQARLFCPQAKTFYAHMGDAWLWLLAVAAACPLLSALLAPRSTD